MAESERYDNFYSPFGVATDVKQVNYVLILHHKDEWILASEFKTCLTKTLYDDKKILVIASYYDSYTLKKTFQRAFDICTHVYVFLTKAFVERFPIIVLTGFLTRYPEKKWHVVQVYEDKFRCTFEIPDSLAKYPRLCYYVDEGIVKTASSLKSDSDVQRKPREERRLAPSYLMESEMKIERMKRLSLKSSSVSQEAKTWIPTYNPCRFLSDASSKYTQLHSPSYKPGKKKHEYMSSGTRLSCGQSLGLTQGKS